jgi:hypothetical protein
MLICYFVYLNQVLVIYLLVGFWTLKYAKAMEVEGNFADALLALEYAKVIDVVL